MSYLPDFSVLLNSGGRVVREGIEFIIEKHVVGVVAAPSGQIVGCDPLTDAHGAAPFIATVPPGRYELRAWVAQIHQDAGGPDVRTAALQLVVSDQPTVRWDPALTEGQNPAELGPDEFFGYPVDAGVGTLADVVAVRALADFMVIPGAQAFIDVHLTDGQGSTTSG
jgi:hypothetical protein